MSRNGLARANFIRGASFGEDKQKDIGERRSAAEKILLSALFETCSNYKHHNTNDTTVITTVTGETVKDLDSYSSKMPIRLGYDPSRAYCEKYKSCQKHVKCKYFKPESRSDETRFKKQKKRIQKYLEEARLLEAHVQASLGVT